MQLKRKNFLFGAVGFTAAAACFPAIRTLNSEVDRVLLVVNLQGGNDGLNTIVPYRESQYYRLRPKLAVSPHEVLPIDSRIGFHPVMRSLQGMFKRGMVAIVQGAGYPRPDHSHFRSTEIWQTAVPDHSESSGWLGRYLDAARLPKENLFNAAALSPLLPPVMVAGESEIPAIAQLSTYRLLSDDDNDKRKMFADLVTDDLVPFRSPYLQVVSSIGSHAQRTSEELPGLVSGYVSAGAYPVTPFGESLALAARIIGSSAMRTRVLYVELGSFDTHAGQKATHEHLLYELSEGLKAFYDDLTAHGNDRRTVTVTFSEFGRRVAENTSLGTDHGEAGPMFVIGGRVKGGVYGTHPSLDVLDDGDLKYTVDFRRVYATLIEQWFGGLSYEVLGGHFSQIPLWG